MYKNFVHTVGNVVFFKLEENLNYIVDLNCRRMPKCTKRREKIRNYMPANLFTHFLNKLKIII